MQLDMEDITILKVSEVSMKELLDNSTITVRNIDNLSLDDDLLIKETTVYQIETGNDMIAGIVGMEYLEEQDSYKLTLEKSLYTTRENSEGKYTRTHYMYLGKAHYSSMQFGRKITGCIIYHDFKPNDFVQVILREEKGLHNNKNEPLMKITAVYKENELDTVTLNVSKAL